MDAQIWIDRLYEDEALTGDLDQHDREGLLAWGENRLAECDSEHEALLVFASIRRMAGLIAGGGRYSLVERLVLRRAT